MIRFENVTRRYQDFVAVDAVSFAIGSGEIVGLLGHNGAGKTTIMKMLTGYLEPSAGSIFINEQDIDAHAQAAQSLIGYLPENLPIYSEMRTVEYLEYCAQMRSIGPAARNAAVRDAIAKTELEEKALEPIATLSRGYKQRVGVAQALLHNPKLLILDEPTNGLDPHQTRHMRELICQLATNATVILSTHIMQEVDAVCDRVLILDNGSLALDESMDALRRSDKLQLETDATSDELGAVISVAGVSATLVENVSDRYIYQLAVPDEIDVNELCAGLAAGVIGSGRKLYNLIPLQRDLETVFREIHERQGVQNAA